MHFIAGAVNYYECSALEGTGLDDIVRAAVSITITKPTRRTFNWLWKRCVSHDVMWPSCYFCCVCVTHSMYNPKAKLPSAFDPLSNTTAPLINIPSSTLRSEWLKMVNNEHLSDVQFYHKMECYHGHKVVLCAASELFWRMFEIGRKLEREENSSQRNTKWCSRWLTAFNRQSNVPIGAFKNIYDK